MRLLSALIVATAILTSGCGGSEQPAPTPEETPADAIPETVVSDKAVPDPCALLTTDEAALLGAPVEAGEEDEIAWDTIRSCTFDANATGFYGVKVIVNTGGFEAVRSMMIGDEMPLDDMGMPAFFEMVEGGVMSIAVEKSGTAIHVTPIWTDRPEPGSERANTLKEVAASVAGRL